MYTVRFVKISMRLLRRAACANTIVSTQYTFSEDHSLVAVCSVAILTHTTLCCSVLQCVAVCCSVLQCVAVCSVAILTHTTLCCSVLQSVAVCCSVLQCGSMRCSVLQRVAVCCSAISVNSRCKLTTKQQRFVLVACCSE